LRSGSPAPVSHRSPAPRKSDGTSSSRAKVAAQTNAVLKSTGGAAGVTADQVSNLAGALLKKSGIDDEAIQSGENLLLTFTEHPERGRQGQRHFQPDHEDDGRYVRRARAGHQELAIQLGKALNDPIKGVTALTARRRLVHASQKEQIKAIVDSGNTMRRRS
jgi:hypothetical protein